LNGALLLAAMASQVDEPITGMRSLSMSVGHLHAERGVAIIAAGVSRMVWPSGLALVTNSVPMIVPPPACFRQSPAGEKHRQPFGDDTRGGVGRAARRIGHDEMQRALGEGLWPAPGPARDQRGGRPEDRDGSLSCSVPECCRRG